LRELPLSLLVFDLSGSDAHLSVMVLESFETRWFAINNDCILQTIADPDLIIDLLLYFISILTKLFQ
jgi:hypothetical protein